MNRADYDRYLFAFNSRDYISVCDFFADPLRMDYFGVHLRSREDLMQFYGFLHSYVKESVRVVNFASSDTLTAVDASVRIEAHRELDAATLAANGYGGLKPIKLGEVQRIRQFIFYSLRDGKISQVECAIPASWQAS